LIMFFRDRGAFLTRRIMNGFAYYQSSNTIVVHLLVHQRWV